MLWARCLTLTSEFEWKEVIRRMGARSRGDVGRDAVSGFSLSPRTSIDRKVV